MVEGMIDMARRDAAKQKKAQKKILGLTNTEDSLWFRLSPGDATLKEIDSIFDIYDDLYAEPEKKILSYAYHVTQDTSFQKEGDGFLAYFILARASMHIILRKEGSWKRYSERILDRFRFSK